MADQEHKWKFEVGQSIWYTDMDLAFVVQQRIISNTWEWYYLDGLGFIREDKLAEIG
jgi:hypothetical protein